VLNWYTFSLFGMFGPRKIWQPCTVRCSTHTHLWLPDERVKTLPNKCNASDSTEAIRTLLIPKLYIYVLSDRVVQKCVATEMSSTTVGQFLTTLVGPQGWSFPLGENLNPTNELCPQGDPFVQPQGGHSLMLEERRGKQRVYTPGG
jgi:hypothetical protein